MRRVAELACLGPNLKGKIEMVQSLGIQELPSLKVIVIRPDDCGGLWSVCEFPGFDLWCASSSTCVRECSTSSFICVLVHVPQGVKCLE